jgi:hypothetical protein
MCSGTCTAEHGADRQVVPYTVAVVVYLVVMVW